MSQVSSISFLSRTARYTNMPALQSQKILKLLMAFILYAQYTAAVTSLFIPGLDPQAITADELGVGSDGLTTWLIAPGQPSGTLTTTELPGPATLVLGASTAVLSYANPTYSFTAVAACGISSGIAVCDEFGAIGGQIGVTSSTVVTERVQSFAVQTGGPSISTASATVTSGSSQTSASATATKSANGATGVRSVSVAAVLAIVAVVHIMMV